MQTVTTDRDGSGWNLRCGRTACWRRWVTASKEARESSFAQHGLLTLETGHAHGEPVPMWTRPTGEPCAGETACTVRRTGRAQARPDPYHRGRITSSLSVIPGLVKPGSHNIAAQHEIAGTSLLAIPRRKCQTIVGNNRGRPTRNAASPVPVPLLRDSTDSARREALGHDCS